MFSGDSALGDTLGNASRAKDGWKEVSVDIQVPDGKKRWGRNATNDPIPVKRLHHVEFVLDSDPSAYGFLDPDEVIRASHLIPAFSHGPTPRFEYTSLARHKDEFDDWKYLYVNLCVLPCSYYCQVSHSHCSFVDRDMFMRYLGGGVGRYKVPVPDEPPENADPLVDDEPDEPLAEPPVTKPPQERRVPPGDADADSDGDVDDEEEPEEEEEERPIDDDEDLYAKSDDEGDPWLDDEEPDAAEEEEEDLGPEDGEGTIPENRTLGSVRGSLFYTPGSQIIVLSSL